MFKIKITEITEREVEKSGGWTVVSSTGEGATKKNEYGYAPKRPTIETKEREVLAQEVETLDIAAVIKAVNGL